MTLGAATRRKLAAVTSAPARSPRQVTMERASELHANEWNAARWLAAIKYLRERSKRGWILDKPATRQERP